MPIVNVEGVGNVQFPDDLSADELNLAVSQIGETAYRANRKAEIRSELSPENMARFNREQDAQWAADNPSAVPSGIRKFLGGAVRLVEDPLYLASEYKQLNPLMMIPGNAEAARYASDRLGDLRSVLNSDERTGINRPAESIGDVRDAYKAGGMLGGAAAVGELGVNAILENLPQLIPSAAIAQRLTAAGMTLKAASKIAPLIATAPMETADALREYTDAGADPLRAKLVAPIVGAINATLETVGDSKLLERAFLPEANGAAKFLLGQVVKEGVTEAAQEGSTMAGRIQAGAPAVSGQEAFDRMLTAGLAGGLAGAGISGGIELGRRFAGPKVEEQRQVPPQQAQVITPPSPTQEVLNQLPPPSNPVEALAQGTLAVQASIERLRAPRIEVAPQPATQVQPGIQAAKVVQQPDPDADLRALADTLESRLKSGDIPLANPAQAPINLEANPSTPGLVGLTEEQPTTQKGVENEKEQRLQGQGLQKQEVLNAPPGWDSVDTLTEPDIPDMDGRLSDLTPAVIQEGNDVQKQVASRLQELNIDVPVRVVGRDAFVSETGKDRAGAYNYRTGEILIAKKGVGSTRLLVHEAVHAATSRRLEEDPEFSTNVSKLRLETAAVLGNEAYGLKDHGSEWANGQEFLAESLSNPEFQAKLKTVKPPGQELTLWQKFVEFIRRSLGLKPDQRNMLDEVLSIALPEFSQPNVTNRAPSFAAEQYRNMAQVQDALNRPGISREGAGAVIQRASAQAAMIPDKTVAQIKSLQAQDPKLTSYDNLVRKRTASLLSWLVDQANAWPSRTSITTMPESTDHEVDRKMAVAGGMLRLDAGVKDEAKRLDQRTQEKLLPKMEKARKSLELARSAGLNAQLVKGMRERIAAAYGEYLQESAQTAVNLPVAELDALRRATDKLANIRRRIGEDPAEIDRAITHIAKSIPPEMLDNMQSPQDVVDYVIKNNVFGSAKDIPPGAWGFLLTPTGSQRRTPLSTFRGLIPALRRIRNIIENKEAAELGLALFERRWANIHDRLKKVEDTAKPVAFRDFLVQYKRLLAEESEAAALARDLNRQFETLDIEIRAREAAKDVYAKMQADPSYRAELTAALDALDALDPAMSGLKAWYLGSADKTGPRTLRYFVGGESYDITWSLEPGAEDKNIETVTEMIKAIDDQLANPDLAPASRRSYHRLRSFADNWLNVIGNSERFVGLRINSLDFINKIRRSFPPLFSFNTRDFLVRMMPGRLRADMLRLASATNAVGKFLDRVVVSPTYGRVRVNLAVSNAIKSHPGLSPKAWDREVLNPLASMGQSLTGVTPDVGDVIPTTGHTITREDIAAVRLQSKFAAEAYKVVNAESLKSGVLSFNPQRIEDKATGMLRKPIGDGQWMLPRKFNRGVAQDPSHESADSWLNEWKKAAATGTQGSLFDQEWFFENVVLAHVAETNTEYKRTSPHEQACRKLASEYVRKRRDLPSTFDELVFDIVSTSERSEGVTDEQLAKIIADSLRSEVSSLMSAFDRAINRRDDENVAGLGVGDLDSNRKLLNNETLVSILDSQSSFTTDRGEMVAPSTFYDYSLSSDASKGGLLKAAIMPFHRRELQMMAAAVDALNAEEKRLRDAVESGLLTNAKIRADVQSGKLYADISQITILKDMLAGSMNLYQESVLSSASHANRDPNLLESFLGVDRSLLLAQPTALISNLINAMSASKVVPYWMLGLKGQAAKNATLLIPSNAINIVARILGNTPQGKWLKANKSKLMPGLRHIAQVMENSAHAAAVARTSGIAPERMTLGDRVDAIKQLGTMTSESPVLANGQRQTRTRSMARVLAKIPGFTGAAAWVTDLTRMADEFGNVTGIDQANQALRQLMLATYRALDSRAKSGVPGWNDWSNPDNALKPEEIKAIGFGNTSMATVRQILLPAGGFEQAAYDFWLRTKNMTKEQRAMADPIASEGAFNDVVYQLLGFTNLPLISNRPDVLRGETWLGRTLKAVTTFPGWISEWLGTIGIMSASSSQWNPAQRIGFGVVALVLVGMLMAFVGASAVEMRRIVYETVQGRTFPTVTPRTLLDDFTPQTAAKVLGASIASSVPYIGEVIADIAGAPTYRSSATDLSSMSRSLSMAADLKSAFEYGIKTGDTVGMIGQLLRTAAPIGSFAWNRIPAFADRNAVADATRAARVAAGPLEVVQTGGRGGGGEPSQFSTLIRRAVAAEIGGDTQGAQSLLGEARELKLREGVGNPDSAIKAALASQMPDRKAFGRTLETSEEMALVNRMSSRQRKVYGLGKSAVSRLLLSAKSKTLKSKKKSGGMKVQGLRLGGGSLKLRSPKLKMSGTGRPKRFSWPGMPGLRMGLAV